MMKLIFESDSSCPVFDGFRLELMRKELREISKRNEKAGQMDYDYHLADCLDEVLNLLDEYLDFDPTPQFLYDNTGGEPPLSSTEMQQQAFNQKMELHK
jgi:hypothetical protein